MEREQGKEYQEYVRGGLWANIFHIRPNYIMASNGDKKKGKLEGSGEVAQAGNAGPGVEEKKGDDDGDRPC